MAPSLRLITIVMAMVVALPAVVATQVSFAQVNKVSSSVARGSSASPAVQGNSITYSYSPAQYRTRIRFDCIVPRFGSGECGPEFFVNGGRTLRVHLSYSGHKRVDFTAYDVHTGDKLGYTRFLYPGETKDMYKNRGRFRKYVYVRASSPAPVRVQAIGSYLK